VPDRAVVLVNFIQVTVIHLTKGGNLIKKLFIINCITLLVLTTVESHASTTVRAKSGSRDDIQAAIDAAPENGTVIIPEGTYELKGPKIDIKKSITIAGEGVAKTTLKVKSALDWIFHAVYNGFLRITGLNLEGNGSGGGVKLRSDNMNFRIDNCTFRDFGTRAIETNGNIRGVIDHNQFLENKITDIVVYGDNDASWNRPAELGTDDAVYVEDNLFKHEKKGNWHSIASNRGSRYVFRYNTINDGSHNTNPVDAHGNYYYGRGSRSYEIYGNTINSKHSYQGMFIRGGTGVIYDNTFNGGFTNPIVLIDYRSSQKPRMGSYPSIDQINDVHIWNNRYENQEAIPEVLDRGANRDYIKHGRDYHTKKKENYKPYTYPHPMTKKPDNESSNVSNVNASQPRFSPGTPSVVQGGITDFIDNFYRLFDNIIPKADS